MRVFKRLLLSCIVASGKTMTKSEQIYIKADPKLITKILELIKKSDEDIKIVDLDPNYKWTKE